jgi:hypothetical protein
VAIARSKIAIITAALASLPASAFAVDDPTVPPADTVAVPATAPQIPPAENGWGFAKWGMTPAALITASAQTAIETPDSKSQRILGKRRLATAFGKFNYIPVSFDYYFEYKIEKLAFVKIQPLNRGTDCAEFEQAVTERLGVSVPDDTETKLGPNSAPLRNRQRKWDDVEHGNSYSFSSISFGQRAASHCQLLIKDAAIVTEGF